MGAAAGDDSRQERVSFLHRRLPASFDLRIVVIDPGTSRPYDETEWRDALVVVEHGQVDVGHTGGDLRCFKCGDVLFLDGLSVVALRNPGNEPVVLSVVTRRGPSTGE